MVAEVASPDEPLVVLFDDDGGGEADAVQIFRVESETIYFDQVQVMTQLGLMPERTTA